MINGIKVGSIIYTTIFISHVDLSPRDTMVREDLVGSSSMRAMHEPYSLDQELILTRML